MKNAPDSPPKEVASEQPAPLSPRAVWRAWWFCLLVTFLVYGIPVFVGSSWLPTPNFPPRADGTRQPAFNAGYDTFSFRYFDLPYREMARQDIADGELPLWNPNSWLGVPMTAQYQNQPFSPLEWLDWLGGNRWWNITLLLRIALAGLGTFLLVRRLSASDAAGYTGAFAYMGSAYFAGFQSVAAFLNGAAVLPWLFLAVDHAFNARRSLGAIAFVGGIFGLAAVNGQPQITLLNFAGAGIFSVAALLAAPDFRHRWRGLLIMGGGALLALAVAAPQLASFHEGLRNGYTIHPPGAYAGGGTNVLHLLLPFMPLLLGPMMSPWLGSLYPSQVNHEAFPLLLGAALSTATCLGILHAVWPGAGHSRRQRWYAPALLLVFLLILGVVIAGSLGWANLWSFPIANQINLPRYGAPMLAFASAVLAALGLRTALEGARWKIALALAITAGAMLSLHQAAWPALNAPLAETNAPLRSLSLLTAELSGWGSWIAIGLLLLMRRSPSQEATVIACGILIAAELSLNVRYGLDLGSESWRLLAWAAALTAALALAWQAQRTAWVAIAASGATIVALALTAPRFLEKSRNPFGETSDHIRFLQSALGQGSAGGRVLTTQQVMIPNILATYRVAQLNGLNPLQPGLSTQWFRTALATRDLNYTLPVVWYGMTTAPDWPGWQDYADSRLLYNFMGVRYLVESSRRELTALNLPDLRLALDTPPYRIWEDSRAWPRALLINGGLVAVAPGADGQATALSARTKASFDSIAVSAPAEIVAALNAGREQPVLTDVSALHIRSNLVRIKTSHPAPALLVLTDVHYPGWRAWIDGVEHPIWTVQGLVRGVALPGGTHEVEFRYHPVWLTPTLGLAVAGWLTILTFAGLAILGHIRRATAPR